MNNLELLDKVLLSDDVVENFYSEYKNNESFGNWLNTNIPDIKKCEEREQNNPWHIYNVLGHILHSVESVNELSKGLDQKERRLLAYTMFFHDIGKPDTCVFRKNKDTFYGHNKRSCEIIEPILPNLGFSEKECNQIMALVYKHDAFIQVGNGQIKLDDKFLDKQIEYFNKFGDGKKLMGYLIIVAKSDNLAQNPEMTPRSLEVLEETKELLAKRNNKR